MTLNQPVGVPFQNPTDYKGPEMNLVPIRRFPREPLTTDKKYRVGQMAILGRNPSTGAEGNLWYLARFESNGDATWMQLAIGSGVPGVDALLTDDGAPAVEPNGSGIIDVLGGTGVVTFGQDPSTAVTIAVDGSVVTTQYDTNSGSATPTAGILNIIGGNGTTSSASGNSVTVEMETPFVGDFSFESNTGAITETFAVQNTVDLAGSGAHLRVIVAGSLSDSNAVITVESSSQRAFGFFIDTSNGTAVVQRSVSGSTTLTEAVYQVDGADAAARMQILAAGGVAISGGGAGTRSFLHIINFNEAVSSNAHLMMQSGDPTIGAGGGDMLISYQAPNMEQFVHGVAKATTPTSWQLNTDSGDLNSGNIAIRAESGGEVLFPSTPAFFAAANAGETNVTGDGTIFTIGSISGYTLIFDQNSNFAGDTFTAPTTGRYELFAATRFTDIGAGHTSAIFQIGTSNRFISLYLGSPAAQRSNANQLYAQAGFLVDMDAGDTATVLLQVSNSTKVIDITSSGGINPLTFFCGSLQC